MKRSAFLQPLSREHHSALKLARACEEAKSGQDVAALCKRAQQAFAAELEPHFRTEERDLLPLLDEELKGRLLDEHRQLREAAAALRQHDAVSLHTFGQLLAAHVRFEERELFAFIQQRIADKEGEGI